MSLITEQICLDGDVETLNLALEAEPGQPPDDGCPEPFIFPATPERRILLSSGNNAALKVASSGAGGERGNGGVMWTASASSAFASKGLEEGLLDWTVFPSTGMLLPGHR